MHIALYKPDIPQNTAAIIRLSACLELKVHIIQPCGFDLNDKRFKRVVMDYIGLSKILKYEDYDIFVKIDQYYYNGHAQKTLMPQVARSRSKGA